MIDEAEKTIETRARAAGLDLALAEFREDVMAAASQVQVQRRALGATRPTCEPWPPMRVVTGP
jgi:hypothetical protein